MRKTLGFGVILAAVYLTGTFQVAYSQTRGGGAAARGTPASSALGGAVNNVEQQAAQEAGLNNNATNTQAVPGQTAPAVPGQAAPAVPGQTVGGVPAPGTVTTAPGNTYQTPGMTGAVVNRPATTTTYPGAATTTTYPGAATTTTSPATGTNYSSYYYQAGSYPGAMPGMTPAYTSRTMQGVPGFNTVNPMGTTMTPGYYYAGTAGMPYAANAYSSMYTTPGSYNAQPYGYPVRQRRGLFGGMFRRRNRVAYPATTYGNAYGTNPYGYTTYSNTSYYTAPGTYTYGPTSY